MKTCPSHKMECPDGRCISYWDSCDPDPCEYWQKKCANGNCIDINDRCPEEPCDFDLHFHVSTSLQPSAVITDGDIVDSQMVKIAGDI